MGGVFPKYDSGARARALNVNLKPSINYPAGTVLAEIVASPGVYGPYATAAVDGLGVAKGILQYACQVDAAGLITFSPTAGASGGDRGQTSKIAPMWLSGNFASEDLIGLDADALVDLQAHVVSGDLTTGVVVIAGA
jgi:hypothetical protein